jgi:hypothetical protein
MLSLEMGNEYIIFHEQKAEAGLRDSSSSL